MDVALGRLLAAKAWRPWKKQWIWPWGRCGLRWRQASGRLLAEGCKGFDVLGVERVWSGGFGRVVEGLERFKGLGAGKRQAWTPIRSHGCGLGTPVGCEGLAALEEAMDLAVGSLWLALEASLWTPVG